MGDESDEFLALKVRAEMGEAKAQTDLGVMYAKGKGVTQDYTEALKWFRKAAEQGYPLAKQLLDSLRRH